MTALEKLSPDELLTMERIAAESKAADRIRSSGKACKHVHRYWSDVDSDIAGKAVAIFEDHAGGLWTAAFASDGGVTFYEGW